MKTSVIGYPRIGSLRELKFAEEAYFRNEISETELRQTAGTLRRAHWQSQKDALIDYIPCNDFSFYDTVLDTAVLFNVIPARYKALGLSVLDTYFSMARGYQGSNGDVRALAMKKWFNTNYHYIVPEIDDDTTIQLTGTKPLDDYLEARKAGINAKVVITGAYTFLKLARYTGQYSAEHYAGDLINAYIELIGKCSGAGVSWIQFDEPFLVHDMNDADIKLFSRIYDSILTNKQNCNILLQTYFGDIRDIYSKAVTMPFDGIGIDFAEGRQSLSLVEKYGFPSDKLLFAGLVNGKNIWKNHYAVTLDTLTLLKKLTGDNNNIVLGTSCSLQHVPYTLANESILGHEYTSHFAFAVEKLDELRELKVLADLDSYNDIPEYAANCELFANGRNCGNEAVAKRLTEVTDNEYTRLPKRAERLKIQKDTFRLPVLPTTTIGSFPQTKAVKANRSAYKKGRISKEEYVAFNRSRIAECVRLQEDIGLDVLVHGEYERNDMVEYFGECLNGFLFTEKAWVQSYGTRCVKPPVIWGDISREKPMTVDWSVYAQSLTCKPMKGMLTGPVTILNWSFPREDISLKDSTMQIALAIRDEVLDLEANGIRIIQIDEAALREKLPLRKSDWYDDYLDWAIPAFRLVHSGVKPDTQIHTHMCYSEFTDIIPAIDAMDADVITFEASRSDLQILDALKADNFQTEVGPGVYDIHSPRIPSVDEIKAAVNKMLTKIDSDKLWINPDCGLKTRGEYETKASLINLVEAARQLRNELK